MPEDRDQDQEAPYEAARALNEKAFEAKERLRKRLAALSFTEKIKILENLRDREKALAAAGLRRKRQKMPDVKGLGRGVTSHGTQSWEAARMIGEIPIVTFDTSAHNRLADDPQCESVLAKMKSMWFRLAGLSIEELFATSPASRREVLFASCRKIQSGPSECFLPSNLLTEQLILAHFNDPVGFDWKTVDARWPDCDREICNSHFYDDDLVPKEQRDLQWERKQSDKQRFVKLRPKLQEIFARHGEPPPGTCQEAMSRLEAVGNSAMWCMAQFYYDLVTTGDSAEAAVKKFATSCPPFLALIYAVFPPLYNNALRDPRTGERAIAGSNDLYMSVYLPYVDMFVTNDGDQQRVLREVTRLANLQTTILSYDDFCATLRLSA